MTLASTTAAAARRPRSRQWGIGEYGAAGQLVYFEVSWDDWRRDIAWARGLLADHGVGPLKGDGPGTGGGSPPCVEKVRGGLVIVGGMAESPWFDPFETAACELGAPYSIGEIYAFEAFRTGLYASRLPVTMIFGLDRTVAEGLGDELAAVVARVPVIVARPDAVGLLAGAGARPFVVTRVGPAIAVECPHRAGRPRQRRGVDPGRARRRAVHQHRGSTSAPGEPGRAGLARHTDRRAVRLRAHRPADHR